MSIRTRIGAMRLVWRLALVLTGGIGGSALVLGLPGCGGGLEVTGGGIGGSGLVAGPIEELGSIVVGGIEFDIDEADIVVNGEAGAAGDLALGMYVSVYGTFDEEAGTGEASRVDFEESVSGPVRLVSPDRRRIVLLEQVVILDDSTRLAGLAPVDLVPGVVVTVSGTRNAEGEILATRIARRIAVTGCRVVGEVEDLSAGGSAFRIENLEIDASGALVVGGALAEGDDVAVFAQTCAAQDVVVAKEIRRLDSTRPPSPGPLRSVRGFVVERIAADRFRMHVPNVGPVVFTISPRTVFEGGARADISRNDLLRVTGEIGSDNVLRAGRVVFLESVSPSVAGSR